MGWLNVGKPKQINFLKNFEFFFINIKSFEMFYKYLLLFFVCSNLPNMGSLGHPFRRTPFEVGSIKKCRTSSLEGSPKKQLQVNIIQNLIVGNISKLYAIATL